MKISELLESRRGRPDPDNVMMANMSSARLKWKQSEKHGPKWTFIDLAGRFGVSVQNLRALVRSHPGFPETAMKTSGNTTSNPARYYDLRDAVKWWNSIKDQVDPKMLED